MIGTKIKIARKENQYTQDELGLAIGVSDKTISAYESGRIEPPIQILEKIAKTTNRSVRYFVDDGAETAILQKLNEILEIFKEIKSELKKGVK